jgi:hypothetical protein
LLGRQDSVQTVADVPLEGQQLAALIFTQPQAVAGQWRQDSS